MKKAFLHIGIFILFSAQMACSHGEDEPEDITTISVNEPGSLSEIIAPSQRGSITKLAVKGSLNYSDISYIHQMPELLYLDVGNVVLPNNYFPDNAISSHEKLEAVILPVSLDSIGASAFRWCERLQAVRLPKKLKSIGAYAFAGCINLYDIELPNSLLYLEKYAFSGCKSLYTLKIPSKLQRISDYTFSKCISLTEIKIPGNIREIGYKSFSGCSGLREISIPSTVKTVGIGAFENCTELKDISLPTTLTEINYYTFSGCTSLTTLTLHSKLTAINNYAFAGCKSLTEIHCKNSNPPLIGENTFRDVNRIGCKIFVPSKRAKKSYSTALYWNEFTIYIE